MQKKSIMRFMGLTKLHPHIAISRQHFKNKFQTLFKGDNFSWHSDFEKN